MIWLVFKCGQATLLKVVGGGEGYWLYTNDVEIILTHTLKRCKATPFNMSNKKFTLWMLIASQHLYYDLAISALSEFNHLLLLSLGSVLGVHVFAPLVYQCVRVCVSLWRCCEHVFVGACSVCGCESRVKSLVSMCMCTVMYVFYVS